MYVLKNNFTGRNKNMLTRFAHKLGTAPLSITETVTFILGALFYLGSVFWAVWELQNASPLLILLGLWFVVRRSLQMEIFYRPMLLGIWCTYSMVSVLAVLDGTRREDLFGASFVILGGVLIQWAANILADPNH